MTIAHADSLPGRRQSARWCTDALRHPHPLEFVLYLNMEGELPGRSPDLVPRITVSRTMKNGLSSVIGIEADRSSNSSDCVAFGLSAGAIRWRAG